MKCLTLLLVFTLTVSGHIRFYQIEKNTVNGGIITYKNFGINATDVSDYFVGTNGQYTPIYSVNNTVVVSGTGPIIPPGGTWTVDYTPWSTQSSNDLYEFYGINRKFSQSSDITLRKNFGYVSSENIVDFIQYCDVRTTKRCTDYGEYWRASSLDIWNSYEFDNRHVKYSQFPVVMKFTGTVNEHGSNYWSVSTTSSKSCNEVDSQILDLIIRLLKFKTLAE